MAAAYLDCQCGVSGDMILGALVDAGCPVAEIGARLAGVPPLPTRLSARAAFRGGVRCTKVDVAIDPPPRPVERSLQEIARAVEAGPLAAPLKDKTLAVLARLTEAECAVRGRAPHEIRIPETDAADLVADVAGAAAGLEILGIDALSASPLRLGGPGGGGPIPSPSVLRLAEGWPILAGGPARELATPTGTAIVTTLARPAAETSFVVGKAGYGAGDWDGGQTGWPNYLRLWTGEAPARGDPAWERDAVWELATHLDNFNPEGTEILIERLFAAGALDVYLAPIQMKKSRPGTLVTTLAEEGAVAAVERLLFAETPTLGVRRTLVQREKLPRRWETVRTRHGPVRFKVASLGGGAEKSCPEYEDLKGIAAATGLPLPAVREEAERAFRENRPGGREARVP